MAWDTTLIERLRYYIYDLDSSNYTWTDTQLRKFLMISAIDVLDSLAAYESVAGGPYTIDTTSNNVSGIMPDIVDNSPAIVSNLVVMRAACIIGQQDYKRNLAAGAGWKIVDDRSTIDGTAALNASKDQAQYYCGSYQTMLNTFSINNGFTGHGVLSPYNKDNYLPPRWRLGGHNDPSCGCS